MKATLAAVALAASLAALAAEPAPGGADAIERKMQHILGQTCGADDRGAIDGLKRQVDAQDAKAYLNEVLANGAPAGERRAAREAAARRFEMRKSVLAGSNAHLFDAATAARMRAVDRESYLSAAEAGIDHLYRGNAIQWLGEIAGEDAIPRIRAAVTNDAALRRLSDVAIAAIERRKGAAIDDGH